MLIISEVILYMSKVKQNKSKTKRKAELALKTVVKELEGLNGNKS